MKDKKIYAKISIFSIHLEVLYKNLLKFFNNKKNLEFLEFLKKLILMFQNLLFHPLITLNVSFPLSILTIINTFRIILLMIDYDLVRTKFAWPFSRL